MNHPKRRKISRWEVFSRFHDSANKYVVQAFTTIELNFGNFVLVMLVREEKVKIIMDTFNGEARIPR